MNNKNKSLKRDILYLVSNRLRNKNESLYYAKTSCQSCVCTNKTLKKLSEQSQKISDIRIKEKKQRQLSIFTNLYQIQISSNLQSKKGSPSSSPRKSIRTYPEQSERSQCDKKERIFNSQQTKNIIRQWVNYSLKCFQGKLPVADKKSINLPMQKFQDLKNLRNKIDDAFDFKVFHSRNSLMGQSQQLNSNFFKKQMKIPHINQIPEKNSFQINQSDISTIQRKVSSLNSKNSSLKLLQSVSTIPSQKVLGRTKQQLNSQDLMRMLYIQADCIERIIKDQ